MSNDAHAHRGAQSIARCVAVVLLATACGTPVPAVTPGTDEPSTTVVRTTAPATTTRTTPPRTTTPRATTPAFAGPIDVEGLVTQPCASLSDAQLAMLGIDGPGSASTRRGMSVCDWGRLTGRGVKLTGTPQALDTARLAGIGKEAAIAGRPAYVLSLADNERCTVAVVLAPDRGMVVVASDPAYITSPGAACTFAQEVAAAVLENVET